MCSSSRVGPRLSGTFYCRSIYIELFSSTDWCTIVIFIMQKSLHFKKQWCTGDAKIKILQLTLQLIVCFSYPLCQPPHSTASQLGSQADGARPTESHQLYSGFPHGRRRGVAEDETPRLTWTCLTLCSCFTWSLCPTCRRAAQLRFTHSDTRGTKLNS